MLAAVRTLSSATVPVIVTDPVGSSLTLVTAAVAELVAVSAVDKSSVKDTETVITEPTSD